AITFVIFYMLPAEDPAIRFAGKAPTPALVAEVKNQLGLDDPIYVQYGRFVRNVFLGDEHGWPGLGFSFDTRSPIREEIFDRTVVTLQLAMGAAIVWLALGIPIGIVSALKRRSIVDRVAMGFALFGISAPVFWLGLMALYLFWEKWDILPGTGYEPIGGGFGDWFSHMILPWFVLALLFAAFYARMVRGNMIETMSEDYIRTARAKGLSERRVVFKHGLRASLTPIVTMFGIDLGTLLGGAVITEKVFNIPGLGDYAIRAVGNVDLPVIVAVVVFAALFISLLNLIVDVVYAYLDPRVRYS
ncbi:MAG: ABC transporter permease, partial [Actinomycetota bacterium]|nr:ABC transporter permease [Actinomycetota bacterium]